MERQVQKYSVNVRVGNWVEDAVLQSEKTMLLVAKGDQGELQKTDKIYDSLLRPVVLDAAEGFLKYGRDTRIVCPDFRLPRSTVSGCSGVTLSCSARSGVGPDGLGPGCALTASMFAQPCVRNCFKISGLADGCEDGRPVKFGDSFTISPCVSYRPLFAAAAVPRLYDEDRVLSDRPAVRLSGSRDSRCRWTVDYWDAECRPEAEGFPVPYGARTIVKHADTGLSLAVEPNQRFSQFFGNEFEVSAHSFKGSARCEAVRHVWQFIVSSGDGGRTGEDDAETTA